MVFIVFGCSTPSTFVFVFVVLFTRCSPVFVFLFIRYFLLRAACLANTSLPPPSSSFSRTTLASTLARTDTWPRPDFRPRFWPRHDYTRPRFWPRHDCTRPRFWPGHAPSPTGLDPGPAGSPAPSTAAAGLAQDPETHSSSSAPSAPSSDAPDRPPPSPRLHPLALLSFLRHAALPPRRAARRPSPGARPPAGHAAARGFQRGHGLSAAISATLRARGGDGPPRAQARIGRMHYVIVIATAPTRPATQAPTPSPSPTPRRATPAPAGAPPTPPGQRQRLPRRAMNNDRHELDTIARLRPRH